MKKFFLNINKFLNKCRKNDTIKIRINLLKFVVIIMKKVIVVSKTHLDLGFTDLAENIRQKYINKFIPEAISLASQVNNENEKNFVWTTGSWILKEALNSDCKDKLIDALKKGDIAPHAIPFTTHTELYDEDTLEYGLSIVDELDEYRGRKTTAAKMTDVPGHTKALINALHRHGIKLLHIGVNGASALPEVPKCFLWKNGDAEIVVIYSGDYGGAFESEFIDEILYFDHTLDNHGAPSPEKVLDKINSIKKKYPDYEVVAGALDEYADAIWKIRDKLPIIEDEIGDTWIHGSATDPYKSGAFRELMALKRKWLSDGSMTRDSEEYINFTDALLCVGEHTCGKDVKMYLGDFENYLKKDFQKARVRDRARVTRPFREWPYNISTVMCRLVGKHYKGSYKGMEESWAEQRAYIDKAINALSDAHKNEAKKAVSALMPTNKLDVSGCKAYTDAITFGEMTFELNKNGGIGYFAIGDDVIIKKNDNSVIEYRSYGRKDYDYWLTHYSRDLIHTKIWAYGDFARPLLKYAEGKYPEGRFFYELQKTAVKKCEDGIQIIADLKCDKKLCDELGAPRDIQIVYTLTNDGFNFDVNWYGKDANRLTEAIFLHLYPEAKDVRVNKLGCTINPQTVVSMGSRNLHATWGVGLGEKYELVNQHSPLVSIGRGKILEFDNKFEDVEKDGLSFVLYNNVWGTNFPLWYEDNAKFTFEIKKESL